MMKKTLLCILISLYSVMAFACTCSFPDSAKEEIGKHDLVFIGKVISKTWVDSTEEKYFLVEIELKEVFKGEIQTKIISIKTGPPIPSCGYPFKLGKTYAVYAWFTQDGTSTNQCTRNTKSWRKEKREIKTVHNTP